MTISGLMERTGLSRSTIHFYLREGLLPQPQKTSINRSLYTECHVELLTKITELKQSGISLSQIKTALREDLANLKDDGVDLAELESERVRRRILRVATEQFMTKGYRQTLVAGIIRKAGITSQVFYSHFPSKGELLVESFKTFIQWNLAFVEPKLMDSPDLGERLLWRVLADFRANQLGSEVLSLVQSEPSNGADLARLTERAWEGIVRLIMADFESVRDPATPLPISPELLAYSLIGAHHNAALRASWDDKFSREQLLGTHLWMWLALAAALSGEVDIDSRFARYKDLIKEVAAREPAMPPALED
jgi:DNA-binding transcriptional MerR regulator